MIVLDSSFLIAFQNSRDAHHAAAVEVMNGVSAGTWGMATLPEYVFLEVVTVLATRLNARIAVETADLLLHAREIDFVPCSDLFREILVTFRAEAGRGLSFTDAAIVTIARGNDTPHVATFDRVLGTTPGLIAVPA